MLSQIKEKLISRATRSNISIERVFEIIGFIEKKITDKEIHSFFISNPYDSYGSSRFEKGYVCIDIALPKYVFGVIFGQNFLRFDITPYTDMYPPDTEIEKNKIKMNFPLKISGRIYKIISYDSKDFDELLSFGAVCIKLIVRE